MIDKKNILRPLSDFVVVEPQKKEMKTAAGGIVFPEMAKKKPQKGIVLTVGPGRLDDHGERIEMEIKAGDVVLYATHYSTEIQIDDRKLLILRESEILAVIEQ